MVRVASVLRVLAIVIMLFALTMVVPLVVSIALQDGATLAYDEGILQREA